jgi:hypothetical protein
VRFVVEKVALGQVLSEYFGLPLSIFPAMLHTRFHLYATLTRGYASETWVPSEKQNSFENQGLKR